MRNKIIFRLLLLTILVPCYIDTQSKHAYFFDDLMLKPGDKGNFHVTMLNDTASYIEHTVDTSWPYAIPFVCALDSALHWIIGFLKNSVNNSLRFYYMVWMAVIFQFSSVCFSLLAMEGIYQFKTLMGGLVIILFGSNFLYAAIFIKSGKIVKKNFKLAILVSAGGCCISALKILLNHLAPRNVTFVDCVKTIASSLCPLMALALPLIISNYFDIFVRYFPVLTEHILFISDFKKVDIKEKHKCIDVTVSAFHFNYQLHFEQPHFEMFFDLKKQVCIYRFTKGKEKVVIKCSRFRGEFNGPFALLPYYINHFEYGISLDKPATESITYDEKSVLMIDNAVRLNDGATVSLQINFKSEKAAKKCGDNMIKIFDGNLPTTRYCCI